MNSRVRIALSTCALCLVGCGGDPSRFVESDAAPLDATSTVDATAIADVATAVDRGVIPQHDSGPALDDTVVYAHSDTTLYAVDPRTDSLRSVGAFAFPAGDGHNHTMTDLAVDASAHLVGVTRDALYRIDAGSAACALVAALPGSHVFVGLTYLPAGVLDPAAEVLVGGATDGTYWRIDPVTGRSTMLGQLRVGRTSYQLSGDLVSVAGAGTFATVRRANAASTAHDDLALVNPSTGDLTVLGTTGFSRIFGLGYWRSTLYGFTRAGEFITIRSDNGRSQLVSMPAMQFSGAGVTTVAPVAPP